MAGQGWSGARQGMACRDGYVVRPRADGPQHHARATRQWAMRRSLGLLIAILAFGLVSLTVPRPAVACSCVSPDDIVANLGVSEDEAVFAGHTGPQTAAGVPVALTAWFGG